MPNLLILAADLVAITTLVLVYHRRHRRRDMVLAYVGLNVGVLAVAVVLAGAVVGVGVGLGLFGVLSIIRLRSAEISQEEVAYYFAALAIGLVCGLQPTPVALAPALSALIVVTLAVVDSPRLNARHARQIVTLDAVYTSHDELVERLEDLLGAEVQRVVVASTDLVRDQTVVDVRYRLRPSGPAAAAHDPHAGTARPAVRPEPSTAPVRRVARALHDDRMPLAGR